MTVRLSGKTFTMKLLSVLNVAPLEQTKSNFVSAVECTSTFSSRITSNNAKTVTLKIKQLMHKPQTSPLMVNLTDTANPRKDLRARRKRQKTISRNEQRLFKSIEMTNLKSSEKWSSVFSFLL